MYMYYPDQKKKKKKNTHLRELFTNNYDIQLEYKCLSGYICNLHFLV